MAWIELTADHIRDRLSINELDTWDDAGQDDGKEISRIPGIIDQTVGLIRGRVASCRDNQLGPAGLIPEELLWAGATIAKYMMLNSIPAVGDTAQSERSEENRRAHDMLDQAADCKLLIADESGATANQVSSVYGGDCKLHF